MTGMTGIFYLYILGIIILLNHHSVKATAGCRSGTGHFSFIDSSSKSDLMASSQQSRDSDRKVVWVLPYMEKALPTLTLVKYNHTECSVPVSLRAWCVCVWKSWKCPILNGKMTWSQHIRMPSDSQKCMSEKGFSVWYKLPARWGASSHGVRIFPCCHHWK